MKRVFLILILMGCIIFIYAEVVDKIVAKVGRDIILRSDLDMRIQQLETAGILTQDISEYDILNQMIEAKIIIQKAKQEEFEIDEYEARNTADKEIKRISAQFPSEIEFKKELKKQGLSILDLKDYYVQMIIEQRLKEKIIQSEIKQKIHITEGEIEDYYNQHSDEIPARPAMDQIGMIMITIKPSEETKEKALIEINKIKNRLDDGEDFAELAKTESDCPSAGAGGDLGFFGKGMMVKPFEEVAFSLQLGEISEVVETGFGFHIIKLEEKEGDEIRVRHILKKIEINEDDIFSAENLMNNILEKLNSGEDFANLATEYSEDDSSAANEGIIGEFTKEEYPEMFKEYLENLDYGKYTSVIREGDVFYIFTKIKEVEERSFYFDEIYENLKEFVTSKKETELYENWMKELMKETYVEIFLDE
ncbi:MAG: peptidylprolyl isomerase [Armatimonadetes bacterium]|nr:peptidylprolyl isomerase [Armatimonadota bacterium]